MIKITDQEQQIISGSVLSLRRNRVNGLPEMSSTDSEVRIAAVRMSLLQDRGERKTALTILLYKLLFESNVPNRWVLVGQFPDTPIWKQICRLGEHYYENYGLDRGKLVFSATEVVAIAAAMLHFNGYPMLAPREYLLDVGAGIKSHMTAIANGARSVTCNKCGVVKVVNRACEVCGFIPVAVRREKN